MFSISGYQRLCFIFAALLLLPPFLLFQFFQSRLAETNRHLESAQDLLVSVRRYIHGQGKNLQVMRLYQNPDPYYLNHSLETLCFLKEEQEQLEKIVRHPHFPGDTFITERLRKLSEQNKIRFVEGKVQTSKHYTERAESFAEPIEASLEDVSTVLQILEGADARFQEGRPLLLFLDFSIKKRSSAADTTYEVYSKLLKREFHS